MYIAILCISAVAICTERVEAKLVPRRRGESAAGCNLHGACGGKGTSISRREKKEKLQSARSVWRQSKARQYREQWVNEVAEVLLEEPVNGHWTGYTPEYIAVTLPEGYNGRQGEFVRVRLTGLNEGGMDGTPCE